MRIVRRSFPLLLVLLTGCGGGDPGPDTGSDQPLATVDGEAITVGDVEARIARLPRLSRPEFAGEKGRFRFLQRLVEEEVLYRAGLDAGLDEDETVRARLEETRRQLVIQSFLDREREAATRVTEEEARAFYDGHPQDYTSERALRVRILLAERRQIAERAREMVEDGALSFEVACQRFSDDPNVIEERGLLPEWVRPGRAVPWLGNHAIFHETLAGLEPMELSPVMETVKGFVVARIEDVREARLRPFAEVEDDVRGRIARQRSTTALPELLEELKRTYRVTIHERPGRSAPELFAAARAAASPRERLALYEELLARFPADERACESRFMVGFILSEELGDAEGAAAAFRQVIAEHPDSELAESARWMLSSREGDMPSFEAEETAGSAAAATEPAEETP